MSFKSLRSVLLVVSCLACAAGASAQSNVRPAPRLVRVPEMGARLLARPAAKAPPLEFAHLWTGVPLHPFASSIDELSSVELPAEPQGFAELSLAGQVHDNADFDSGGGDVAIVRGSWSGAMGTHVDDARVVALTLDAEASFYDFSGAVDLMAGSSDPFNDVYDSRFGVMVLNEPASRQSWFAGLELGFSGEDDAELREALSVGGVGGMRFGLGNDGSVSLGVAVLSRLEDDPWVIPYLGFDVRLGERVRLVSEGSRLRAVFAATERLDLELSARYEIRQFRLNDDSPLPSGVVQDEEITAGAGVLWRISEGVSLRLEAGAALWRELESFDEDGTQMGEVETDPSFYGGFEIGVTL